MNIGNLNSQFATYSLKATQTMSKEQATQIIEAGLKIQAAPSTAKLASQVSASIERSKVNILA
ncbi:MAG: hypothetical protein GX287_02135 [Fusobacteria bacterium]|nr:hypothetical protein [Fusobacteriota bacterium]